MERSDGLREQLESLKELNRNRFDYVLARAQSRSIEEALTKTGLSSSWYYKFDKDERNRLEALADRLHYEHKVQAEVMLQQAASDAARVKVDGLKSKDKRIQQDAASEILDRVMGKPVQKNEHSGPSGGPIETKSDGLTDDERIARIAALLDRARARRDGQADS